MSSSRVVLFCREYAMLPFYRRVRLVGPPLRAGRDLNDRDLCAFLCAMVRHLADLLPRAKNMRHCALLLNPPFPPPPLRERVLPIFGPRMRPADLRPAIPTLLRLGGQDLHRAGWEPSADLRLTGPVVTRVHEDLVRRRSRRVGGQL